MGKISYFKWGTRPGSVFRDQPFIMYLQDLGLHSFMSVPAEGGNTDYYMEHDSYYKLMSRVTEETLKNWEEHLKGYSEKRRNLVESAKAVKKAVDEGKGKEEMLKLFDEYTKSGKEFGIYIFIPWAFKDLVEPGVLEKFPEKFDVISGLDRPTIFHEFQKALFEDDIEDVHKKYAWLNVYSPIHQPFTIEQIKKQKDAISKEEIYDVFDGFVKNKKEFEEFIETVEDESDKAKCILMHEYAFLRTDRIDAWKESLYYLTSFVVYLAKLIDEKCKVEYTQEVFYDEIRSVMLGGEIPTLDELKVRAAKKGVFYYTPKSSRFVPDGEEKEKLLRLVRKVRDSKELKGVSASKGIGRGKVKLVFSDKDFEGFEDGDVLVAKFTEPKYTPIMKRASAIVTDEGGITSHAAIVSRELGKPCVIGTLNATSVLKDSYEVEVDANKGVVRILGDGK